MLIRNGGAEVFQTRSEDVFLSRGERAEHANSLDNLSWFISIHLNASNNSSVNGSEVWYFHSKQSCKNMATMMSYKLANKLSIDDRGAKSSGPSPNAKNIYLLANSINPANLAECSFITNPTEENLLKTTDRAQQMAQAIYDGILDYYTPPYARKVTVFQEGEKKYEAEWQEGTTQREVNVLLNSPISNHSAASLSLEFNTRIKNVLVKVEGWEIKGSVDAAGKTWTGVVSKEIINILGSGMQTIEILATDYAGNEIDGNPKTIAKYDVNSSTFQNSEDAPDRQHRFNVVFDIVLYSSRFRPAPTATDTCVK